MIGEVTEQILIGGVENVLSLKEEILPSLSIVSCLTLYEHEMCLRGQEKWKKITDEYRCEIFRAEVDDSPLESLGNKMFENVAKFVSEQIEKKKTVLIHCNQGRSRAATFTIATLLLLNNNNNNNNKNKKTSSLTMKEALRKVKFARPRIFPNYGFCQELILLEKSLLEKSENEEKEEKEKDEVENSISTVEEMFLYLDELLENEIIPSEKLLKQLEETNRKYCSADDDDEKEENNNSKNQDEREEEEEKEKEMTGGEEEEEVRRKKLLGIFATSHKEISAMPGEIWLPKPVQVSIPEYFQLSLPPQVTSMLEQKEQKQEEEEGGEQKAIRKYREYVLQAQQETEISQLQRQQKHEEKQKLKEKSKTVSATSATCAAAGEKEQEEQDGDDGAEDDWEKQLEVDLDDFDFDPDERS